MEWFISKVYKSSNSLVVTVPMPVRISLGLKRGDRVLFTLLPGTGQYGFQKFEPVGARDVEAKKEQDVIPAAISPR